MLRAREQPPAAARRSRIEDPAEKTNESAIS
jgi:hypothetical protein